MYDPLIGRWLGADPYRQFASPYVGMGNDPVNLIDPDGGGAGGLNAGTGLWNMGAGWGLIGGAISASVAILSHGTQEQAGLAFVAGFAGGVGAYYTNWPAAVNAIGDIAAKFSLATKLFP
jgi:hypothetical protein